jgi:hypothetical protein
MHAQQAATTLWHAAGEIAKAANPAHPETTADADALRLALVGVREALEFGNISTETSKAYRAARRT